MTTPQDPENGPPQQPHTPPSTTPHKPFTPPPPLSESELAGPAGHGAPVVAEPKEVRLSFWLWIAAAALLVLSSVLVLTERDAAVEAARRAGGTQGLTEEQFVSAVTATLIFLVIVGIVLAALMAFFAYKVRSGRNWARISLTVLGALVFLYHLLGFSLLGMLIVLVVAVAVVTLYLPASKQYFDSVKRAG